MSQDPFCRSFGEGEAARDAGLPRSANPHHGPGSSRAHRGYDSGWLARDCRLAARLERNAALEAAAHG